MFIVYGTKYKLRIKIVIIILDLFYGEIQD